MRNISRITDDMHLMRERAMTDAKTYRIMQARTGLWWQGCECFQLQTKYKSYIDGSQFRLFCRPYNAGLIQTYKDRWF